MTLILFQCDAVLFSIQIIVVNDNSLNMVARYTCFTCTAGIEVCCFLGIIKITVVSNYTWKLKQEPILTFQPWPFCRSYFISAQHLSLAYCR